MARITGSLPEGPPGTTTAIFRFRETGLTEAVLETADFVREERARHRDVEVLGVHIDERGDIYIYTKEVS